LAKKADAIDGLWIAEIRLKEGARIVRGRNIETFAVAELC
jgi:hypothetical protein